MKLIEYLDSEYITVPEFAKRIEYCYAHLWAYLHGKHGVSKRFAKAIEKATNGNVTIREVMLDNPPGGRYNLKSKIDKKIKLAE